MKVDHFKQDSSQKKMKYATIALLFAGIGGVIYYNQLETPAVEEDSIVDLEHSCSQVSPWEGNKIGGTWGAWKKPK